MSTDVPSTAAATAAVAQSREPEIRAEAVPSPPPGTPIEWRLGPNLTRGQFLSPYRRQKNEPIYRPLRIYALDPSQSKLQGAVATVNVPFEPLENESGGLIGRLFEVDAGDGGTSAVYEPLDLNHTHVLLTQGVEPSPSNPLFHQQMTYAVASNVYNTFKIALGRDLSFGFRRTSDEQPERLRLSPFAGGDRNAFYDPNRGAVRFGYFEASNRFVFTSLSHDIIAHEISHAMLDGLRTHFTVPTNPDVLALHEALGDIVAILQHFSYPEVLHAAIRTNRGDMSKPSFLADLAREFARTTGQGTALRTAIDFSKCEERKQYDPNLEVHELGAVLVAAVFETFTTIFQRKALPLLRLASQGTGILPAGDLPYDLQKLLAQKAAKLANQILTICIRAIDYCPAVDVTFGEYLRAVITADIDLVPDDRWGYREAWLDACRERGIHPSNVKHLSEDAVKWRPPERLLPEVPELSFAKLQFKGDPAHPMGEEEVRRQARELARVVCTRETARLFGLAAPDDELLDGDDVEPPVIESIRSSRRVGPDNQIEFDLVAEIIQVRRVRAANGVLFPFFGGSTVITGPNGDFRYAIVKGVTSRQRLARQAEYLSSRHAGKLWQLDNGEIRPNPQLFQLLHHDH